VAPQVTLHAVKVLGLTGSGWRSGVIAGIDWVAAHNPDRVRVINMSLGGSGEKVGSCTLDGYEGDPDAYHESICNAKNAGVVIVVSAGNSSMDASLFAPASYYDAVITVSAVECRSVNYWDPEERCGAGTEGWTTWSNFGIGSDGAWPSRNSLPVIIGAPGLHVRSTTVGGGIGYMSGTSMASPHVAGAVALLLQGGSYSADGSAFSQVRQTLLNNAECTASWEDSSGLTHNESFLNLQTGSGECAPPRDPPPAPEAPTDLAAEALSDSAIRLTWTYEEPVPADVQFQLTRWNGIAWSTSFLLGQDLSYTNANLPPETTFTYRVRAVRAGVSSEWSAGATATTLAPPAGPDPEASFSYGCNKDICNFAADHRDATPYYTWDFEHSSLDEEQGAWQSSTRFPAAGAYVVRLTVRVGTATATDARTVTCEARGRNVFCQ
jgi:subtilisin family serine protease